MDNRQIAVFGGIALGIFLIFLFLFQVWGRDSSQDNILGSDFNLNQQASPTPNITQLQGQDLKVGSGSAQVSAGDTIVVHYEGKFLDGKKFDSSYERGQPFSVTIGARQVIPGFEQGVLGMRLGGKRRLLIPSNLAYGTQGAGNIPPNTPIQFEVELLEIKAPTPTPEPEEEESPEETPTPSGPETP